VAEARPSGSEGSRVSDVSPRLAAAVADRYRIERRIGQGGMATVYLAHDVRHDRKVALKVLHPELTAVLGAERFLQEIRVTANLHHPHILPVHDSGEADSFLFYVMPFVEGESLRDKLNRERHLDIQEAIEITKSVAGALDYAHRHGVIHRDIKPENILLHDGHPSVSDFGIALAVRNVGAERLTDAGLSLGTPHYMSPEQAMGDRELDGRSDIYSLGVVLYEMLAGDPPYTGSTAQAVVAKVITEKAPPLKAIRDTVPVHIAWAAHKALAKLPADRFPTAIDFAEAVANRNVMETTAGRLEIQAGAPTQGWLRGTRLAAAAGGVAFVATAVAAWAWFRPPPEPAGPLARFSLSYPDDAWIEDEHGSPVALSPDGTAAVYAGTRQLYLRRLDEIDPVPIPNTAGGSQPFFSPDGQALGFHAQGKLKRVAMNGGPAVTICEAQGILRGASWGAGNSIVFSLDTVLLRVPASGGAPEAVARPDSTRGEAGYRWPSFLPDGRRVLLTMWKGGNDNTRIGVVDLASGLVTPITTTGTSPRFVEPGWLTYATGDGTVFSAAFDPRAARVTGTARPVMENVRVGAAGAAKLGLSARGWAVYLRRSAVGRRLVLVDRQGAARPVPGEVRPFSHPRFSPDGRKVAVMVNPAGSTSDVWVIDLEHGTQSRLTFEAYNQYPEWSPDGKRVLFASNRKGGFGLFSARDDGAGTAESLLVNTGRGVYEGMLTPDARALVYRIGNEPSADVYYLALGGAESRPFLTSAFNERSPALSPDGRWLSYVSNESGRDEVYVRPFPQGVGRWQISSAEGREPRWASDGRALFYRKADTLVTVQVRTQPEFSVGARAPLFTGPYLPHTGHAGYDVHPDGLHFIFVAVDAGSEDLVFVQGLFSTGRAVRGAREP
jgi:eukaryotic-like serine/threonine-protein kinase